MFFYVLALANQIYIPCLCGSDVTFRSDQLSYSIFKSNWIEQSAAFKKSMLIFVEGSIKPIIPMAGGLFEIGLPRFVAVSVQNYFATQK